MKPHPAYSKQFLKSGIKPEPFPMQVYAWTMHAKPWGSLSLVSFYYTIQGQLSLIVFYYYLRKKLTHLF